MGPAGTNACASGDLSASSGPDLQAHVRMQQLAVRLVGACRASAGTGAQLSTGSKGRPDSGRTLKGSMHAQPQEEAAGGGGGGGGGVDREAPVGIWHLG